MGQTQQWRSLRGSVLEALEAECRCGIGDGQEGGNVE